MKRSCAISLIAVLTILSGGCATKKTVTPDGPAMLRKHQKLPLKQGVNIRFEGIKDGKCVIGDVLLDAKTGGYVVVCK